jgi:uncharacterized protein (DUF302 family)
MYGFTVDVDGGFDAVVGQVTDALKREGFGVLTEIDVQATLKAKLGLEKAPYKILGACNPTMANRALDMEPDIGLLLPCNVVVREREPGKNVVGFMDPAAVLGLVDNPELSVIGRDVRERLERVRNALAA